MKQPTISRCRPTRYSTRLLLSLLLVAALGVTLLLSGCTQQEEAEPVISTDETPTTTAPPYIRRNIEFFQGVAEPADWNQLLTDSDRLLEKGFNSVTLSPPVYISQRAGGRPRVILEGQAASVESLIRDFHDRGLAVHLSPTTRTPGYNEMVEPEEVALQELKDDALEWSRKAEDNQAELFSPLSDYNLVLGTAAANEWSAEVLPLVRNVYKGPVGAKVVPDLDGVPPAGQAHDFEALDFRGYDYLLLDVFPRGDSFDPQQYDLYVIELLDRANLVARRDGLKGVIVSEFGSWREAAGIEPPDGPQLDEDTQALMSMYFLIAARPRTQGIFFYGWTLPGRGARGFFVEEVLRANFAK